MGRVNEGGLKPEQIKKDKEGKIDFFTIDVPRTADYSRICYFPHAVTVKMLTDEIRALRTDHKMSMLMIPDHLSMHFKHMFYTLEDRDFMAYGKIKQKSEMGLDMRSADERNDSRFNIEPVALNAEFQAFKSGPKIVHR